MFAVLVIANLDSELKFCVSCLAWTFELSTELFEHLRQLALEQGVLKSNETGQLERADGNMRYFVLGQPVCRDAYCRLHGIGESPRLETILGAVLNGSAVCPTDVRFLKKSEGFTKRSPNYGEMFSFIQSLYDSVAETLPEDEWGEDDFELPVNVAEECAEAKESEDILVHAVGIEDYEEDLAETQPRKHMPPGSIFEQFRQFKALGHEGSFKLFIAVWKSNFPNLLFRSTHRHTVCPICVKHKLLLKVLSADARAFNKQQLLYQRHLRMQFKDRTVYWNARSQSRLPSAGKVTIICDAMDQQKFCWPRGSWFSSHEFGNASRPRLHNLAALVHGHGVYFMLTHMDTNKGSSTTLEFLSFILTDLYQRGVCLQDKEIHLQLDNAPGSNKNNQLCLWAGALVFGHLVQSLQACFLRVGHTHEAPGTFQYFRLGVVCCIADVAKASLTRVRM